MQTHSMAVRRNVILFALDGDDWRQSCADVVDRRELCCKLFCVTQTSKPLTRVVPRVWTFNEIRHIANAKPVNNRGNFRLDVVGFCVSDVRENVVVTGSVVKPMIRTGLTVRRSADYADYAG